LTRTSGTTSLSLPVPRPGPSPSESDGDVDGHLGRSRLLGSRRRRRCVRSLELLRLLALASLDGFFALDAHEVHLEAFGLLLDHHAVADDELMHREQQAEGDEGGRQSGERVAQHQSPSTAAIEMS
jgi:hypothetical protein